ncbi:uncharacterized protein LOC125521555 [Triticum urartu]|uniref:uncharacterized protein LOC125521555 n=1 Tax=Triticum urartu TaxID=4572 RepID=UPI002042BE71|nr:uncharacterized protein LOC125521555 [Triticum urartu]
MASPPPHPLQNIGAVEEQSDSTVAKAMTAKQQQVAMPLNKNQAAAATDGQSPDGRQYSMRSGMCPPTPPVAPVSTHRTHEANQGNKRRCSARDGSEGGCACTTARRAVHIVDSPVVANGGFIQAPGKPTNQSKSGGLRDLCRDAVVQEEEP